MATINMELVDIRPRLYEEFKTLGKWVEEKTILYDTGLFWHPGTSGRIENVSPDYVFRHFVDTAIAHNEKDIPKSFLNTMKKLKDSGYKNKELSNLLVDAQLRYSNSLRGGVDYVIDIMRIAEKFGDVKEFSARYKKLRESRSLREQALYSDVELRIRENPKLIIKENPNSVSLRGYGGRKNG
jgi:hypothetical protein